MLPLISKKADFPSACLAYSNFNFLCLLGKNISADFMHCLNELIASFPSLSLSSSRLQWRIKEHKFRFLTEVRGSVLIHSAHCQEEMFLCYLFWLLEMLC